ncbi:hypothetical protein B9Z19DRAFT_1134978 [Tuber borchii]|uniref:Uncharacterized protein n=1 Tax=Tuber borchii TaxID=42251 RepID=A0A2T6ZDK9_TUBBO|nr:hypothetical protein B9Z19DRAFT_1134978 [Tuber borchii]
MQWSKRLQEADPLRLKSTVELEAMRFELSEAEGKPTLISAKSGPTCRISSTLPPYKLSNILAEQDGKIVKRGKLAEKISPTAGTQEGLNELAKRKEFTTILKDEVEARGLTVQRVMASFHRLDSLLSKPLRFNARATMVVRRANFTNEERAALVILLKVQERWPKGFLYYEDRSSEKDEH